MLLQDFGEYHYIVHVDSNILTMRSQEIIYLPLHVKW